MQREALHTGRRNADERGVTVVFFAISLTALLAVGALVLGGSTGYTAVRNAQTAADSAALAGAATLRDHKRDWVTTPAGVVLDTVRSIAADNGTTLAPGGCELVDADYALTNSDADVIGECSQLATLSDADFKATAGVRVTVEDRRDVPLAAFLDQSTITGKAVAAATVQAVRDRVRAPFMLCAFASGHTPPLLQADGTTDPPYVVNEAAIGHEYLLWSDGNAMGDRNCGVSAWHGLVNTDVEYQIPSDPNDTTTWWDIDTGSRVGHLSGVLAGSDACTWARRQPDVGLQSGAPAVHADGGERHQRAPRLRPDGDVPDHLRRPRRRPWVLRIGAREQEGDLRNAGRRRRGRQRPGHHRPRRHQRDGGHQTRAVTGRDGGHLPREMASASRCVCWTTPRSTGLGSPIDQPVITAPSGKGLSLL